MENAEKKALYDIIDADAADFEAMSDFVWDHPETCFREFESTRYQREYMEKLYEEQSKEREREAAKSVSKF